MSTPPLALIDALLVDPETGTQTRGGALVADGVIRALGPDVTAANIGETRAIDCAGDVVCPGLIDMRVFVGEPGAEHRETIATAGLCASPTTTCSASVSASITPMAPSKASAIARSKCEPSLGRSAGDRFTVIRLGGSASPIAAIAPRTRSRLSATALSGSPTTTNAGNPATRLH